MADCLESGSPLGTRLPPLLLLVPALELLDDYVVSVLTVDGKRYC